MYSMRRKTHTHTHTHTHRLEHTHTYIGLSSRELTLHFSLGRSLVSVTDLKSTKGREKSEIEVFFINLLM